jgi:hypothetical protein
VGTQAIPSLYESLFDALRYSTRLRAWHIRWLFLAYPPAILVPDAWLPGIPLHLGVNTTYGFPLSPVTLDPSGTNAIPTLWSFPDFEPTYSYNTQWFEPTIVLNQMSTLPGSDPNQLQIVTLGILNMLNPGTPRTPIQFNIPLRASLDKIKTPIDPQSAGDALQSIAPRLVQQPPTGSWGITTSPAGAGRTSPQTTVFALRLTILRDGKPIAEARWRQRPGESLSTMGTPARLREPGSTVWGYRNVPRAPAITLDLDPNDSTLTVRITTDEELVLCDFSATHYWRGDVTLPISALFAPTP